MRRSFIVGCAVASCMAASAFAQADSQGSFLAPLPSSPGDTMRRIAPENPADADMLTTKHGEGLPPVSTGTPFKPATVVPVENPPPVQLKALPPPVANPPQANPAAASPFGYSSKSPFQHAEPQAPPPPSGPHAAAAVPVDDVDAVESSDAAPATPVPPSADPAKEDPTNPTELTSPIFEPENGANWPRKIIFRVLNKVTGQSQTITLKPGENMTIGQLMVTAVTCQTSSPRSQKDYAGLIDIAEKHAGENTLKPLFRGWMYASSPSITALEHPVYDVTMVECVINQPATKDDKKTDDTAKNGGKKAKK